MNLIHLFTDDDAPDTKLAKEARRPVTASVVAGLDEEDDIAWGEMGIIDHVLQGRTIEGSTTTSVRALTDAGRAKGALQLPVEVGTRVMFVANLGSVLSYADIPGDKMAGTVIKVRSAAGDVTASEGGVHVLWDDGKFRPILAEHLRAAGSSDRRASSVRMRFTTLGDLSALFALAGKEGSDLVHKATKDLWSFRQDGGEYVIERLFTEDGSPLKV
jgi:hypothetical protein